MARIRTIKPEIVQSESLGRCSREARLTFILIWTQADDSGRLRANSRMLASFLYPYDDDAKAHIEGWLRELEAVGCIRRYEVDGVAYMDIPHWLDHQKIDRPTPSRIPAYRDNPPKTEDRAPTPREDTASPRDTSRAIGEQSARPRASRARAGPGPGPGRDLDPPVPPLPTTPMPRRSTPPPEPRPLAKLADLELDDDLRAWAAKHAPGLDLAAELAEFRDWLAASGRKFRDYRAAFRNSLRRHAQRPGPAPNGHGPPVDEGRPWWMDPEPDPPEVVAAARRTAALKHGFWLEGWGEPPPDLAHLPRRAGP